MSFVTLSVPSKISHMEHPYKFPTMFAVLFVKLPSKVHTVINNGIFTPAKFLKTTNTDFSM